MKICFEGRVTVAKEWNGVYMNTIDVRMPDGQVVTLDRDETNYDMHPDGTCDIEWHGVYKWDGENPDYNITEDDFRFAEIVSYSIEDDAPDEYDLTIISATIPLSREIVKE